MSTNATTPSLPERVVEYVGYADAALEKASRYINAEEARRQKMASLIPAAVDALVAGERIREDQRKQAAEMLRDPVQLMELLIKVAAHRNGSEQPLGTPVGADGQPVKQSSAPVRKYNSLTDPNPGARTTQVKESSIRLFQKLGLNAPTS